MMFGARSLRIKEKLTVGTEATTKTRKGRLDTPRLNP